MGVFLAANLGEVPVEHSLREAMTLAQQGSVSIGPRNLQALAWEILFGEAPTIVEKYGGLQNASAYIGMIPRRKLGIVILGNRSQSISQRGGPPDLARPRRCARGDDPIGSGFAADQALGGEPSYSRTRSLRTVSSSTSNA
jgi:hypothetical protein